MPSLLSITILILREMDDAPFMRRHMELMSDWTSV